jgi:hypothetical protein
MASFTAGTTFVDGVSNDVTAAKLGALVTNATPTSGFIQDRTAETVTATNDTLLIGDASDSNNLKRITVANFAQTLPTAKVTTGTIDTGTFGTTTSTAATITTGTIPTLTTGTTTSTNEVVTNGTITNLSATTSTFLGTITGSTNVINIGSGQIYKDASGNVGIGVTSPVSKLSVYGTNTSDSGAIYSVNILNTATASSGVGSGLVFGTNISTTATNNIAAMAGIEGIKENGTTGNYASALKFTTRANGASLAEAMRIDSSANVGIGTASPTNKLHVVGASSSVAILAGDGTVSAAIAYPHANGTNYFGTTSNHAQAFLTNNIERMRIDSSGGVGIGITSPTSKLDVYGDGYFQNIKVGKAGQTGNRDVLIDFVGDATYTDYGFRIIRQSGGANANTLLTNRGTGGIFLITEEAGDIVFRTTNTDRLRIDSSGNCSIGTATALSKLHVHGDLTLSNTTTAVTAATGGVSKPATYAGFLTVSINGTSRKIPYYA